MPQITTQETKWLAEIEKRLRQLIHMVQNTSTSVSQFTIGDAQPDTPSNGASSYINPTLDGRNFKVYQNGVGYLTEGTDYSAYPGGGFTLLGGDTFTTGESFLVWVY